jgi:hypothetical protein
MCTGRPFYEGVSPEKATSRTLPHLSGKTLEGTLSPVTRGTEARASHPMMGPRAYHTGSCDHHKSRGAPGFIHYLKAQGQPPYQYGNQHLSYSFLSWTQVLQEYYYSGHIRPASRMLLHSEFIMLLGRFPFLSLFFNCPRNPYSSARERPSI